MSGNFEFPSSLGKKRKSEKSYGSCYLGKEVNQSIGRNKVFLNDSYKINFFFHIELDRGEKLNFSGCV